MTPVFLQHVRVSAILKRKDCKWEVVEVAPFVSVVIGKRTLSNGHMDFDEETYAGYYEIDETFPAYLVVRNERRTPVYTLEKFMQEVEMNEKLLPCPFCGSPAETKGD